MDANEGTNVGRSKCMNEGKSKCTNMGMGKGIERGRVQNRMNVADKVKNEKGSATIEGLIIIPLVLLTVCLMIYLTCLLFERGMLLNATGKAAIEASAGWKESEGAASYNRKSNLYWRTYDNSIGSKAGAAQQAAEKHFKRTGIEGFTSVDGYSEYKKGLLAKRINAGLKNRTTFPGRIVMRYFRQPTSVESDISSRSIIPDNAEFIRNIDHVVELEKELEKKCPKLAEVANSYQEALERIRGFIGGL